MMRLTSILLLMFVTLGLRTVDGSDDKQQPQNFVAISVAKSGTHMLVKLLTELTEKTHISFCGANLFKPHDCQDFLDKKMVTSDLLEKIHTRSCKENKFLVAHFNRATLIEGFIQKYKDYKTIVLVRDLRDVAVSYTHWLYHHPLAVKMGVQHEFNAKLMWMIRGCKHPHYQKSTANISRQAQVACEWIKNPEFLVVRFEDLCGEKGGGTQARQRSAIQQICEHLQIKITEEKLSQVVKNLWGEEKRSLASGKGSFRKGKIGCWKEDFLPRHKIAFKQYLGKFLIQMGYEKDSNW